MFCRALIGALILSWLAAPGPAQELPDLDLTQAANQTSWKPTHSLGEITPTAEGLRFELTGDDPYSVGPTLDFPADTPLWFHLRLRSEFGGMGEIFWGRPGFVAGQEAGFEAPAGEWVEVAAPLPALGPQTTLRIDPPGIRGECVIARIWFTPRVTLASPDWPAPTAPTLTDTALTVRSGELLLRHDPARLGAFELQVAGRSVAAGWDHCLIGTVVNGQNEWLDLATGQVSITPGANGLQVTASLADSGGATWRAGWLFAPHDVAGTLRVTATLTVDQPRELAFAPLLMLFPGLGSHGAVRDHGLFCGLEYLDRPDTSSSEADLIGPESSRQVPWNYKITIPLMAIEDGGRYVGLLWEPQPDVSATFDSPDRLFGSSAHVMGLLAPGSTPYNREEGALLPYGGMELAAGQILTLNASLIGGRGESVVPAVQHYLALNPLPDLPDPGLDKTAWARWTAGGWLDSSVHVGDEFKHAYWPEHKGFPPHPAADAPVFMEWLATQVDDSALAARLRTAAEAALALVPGRQQNTASVSHVRYPVAPLLTHTGLDMVGWARENGQQLTGRFEADGRLLYRQATDKPDFGSTHWEPDANGLTAASVAALLQMATLTADPDLTRQGLTLLRGLDRFRNSAPRGAQTWEIALHTPDILASAHLVRAYVLGYELSGDEHFLDEARYWAWTGLPFVYLVPPVPKPMGIYSTIAVYGATHWTARPSWMGRPVQWCGLVYGEAIARLARYDDGPWRKLADGIALSGVQQSFPADADDLQALLPDSILLLSQRRLAVAINPGTVQSQAIRAYGGPAVYDYHFSRSNGLAVHAPGRIRVARDEPGALDLSLEGWSPEPWDALFVGLAPGFEVTVDGQAITQFDLPHAYDPEQRALTLRCTGTAKISLTWP